MPTKNPRGQELTLEQEQTNQALHQRRLRIEHIKGLEYDPNRYVLQRITVPLLLTGGGTLFVPQRAGQIRAAPLIRSPSKMGLQPQTPSCRARHNARCSWRAILAGLLLHRRGRGGVGSLNMLSNNFPSFAPKIASCLLHSPVVLQR